MIKVTVGEHKTQEVKPFPKLMITNDRIIVLFTTLSDGTVIDEAVHCWGIGHYSDSWDMRQFTDFNEPITIQNA